MRASGSHPEGKVRKGEIRIGLDFAVDSLGKNFAMLCSLPCCVEVVSLQEADFGNFEGRLSIARFR